MSAVACATVTPRLQSCHYQKPMEVMVDLLRPGKLAGRTTRSARGPSRRAQARRPRLYCRPSRRIFFARGCCALRHRSGSFHIFMGENDLKLFCRPHLRRAENRAPRSSGCPRTSRKTRGTRLRLELVSGWPGRGQAHLPACPRSHRFKGGAAALPVQVNPQPRLRCGRPLSWTTRWTMRSGCR